MRSHALKSLKKFKYACNIVKMKRKSQSIVREVQKEFLDEKNKCSSWNYFDSMYEVLS